MLPAAARLSAGTSFWRLTKPIPTIASATAILISTERPKGVSSSAGKLPTSMIDCTTPDRISTGSAIVARAEKRAMVPASSGVR